MSAAPVISISDYPLIELVHGLQEELRAVGVAIALRDDEVVICRAAAGDAAPPAGTELPAGEGITWQCLSSGAEVVCRDIEQDSRVNRALCRELGIEALLLVPVRHGEMCAGLVEAMFRDSNDCSDGALASLRQAAERVAKLAEQSSATRNQAKLGTEGSAEAGVIEFPVPLTLSAGSTPRHFVPFIVIGSLLMVALLGVLMLTRATWAGPSVSSPAADAASSSATAETSPSALPAPLSTSAQPLAAVRDAAASGNSDAQRELAQRLESTDRVEASTWYLVAALAGNANADAAFRRLTPQLSDAQIARVRLRVGDLYSEGKALPRDLVQAYRWFYLSAAAGHPDARTRMAELESRMTPAAINTATSGAQKWLARHRPSSP